MEAKQVFSNARIVRINTNPADYHRQKPNTARGNRDYVMSRSELTEFAHCPHRWFCGYERKEAEGMAWGNLLDCLVLEPGSFDSRYAVSPATYPADPKRKGDPVEHKAWNRNATYCREWEENQIGKIVIKQEEYNRAKAAAKYLMEDLEIGCFLECSKHSVFITADYNDPATGLVIPIKILIDAVPKTGSLYGKGLGDLKTCETAHPRSWPRSVHSYNYHVQGAFYLDVYNAATGEDRVDFFHMLQESYPPWECGHRLLSAEFLEMGRLKYRNALALYAHCVATNHWPTYEEQEREVWNGWQVTKPELRMIG